MRKELGKAVREQFARRIAEELPEFEAVPLKEYSRAPWNMPASGSRVFRKPHGDDLYFFVVLSQSVKAKDWFMIDVGWNISPEYPGSFHRKERHEEALALDSYSVRLPDLFRSEWKSSWQPWWTLGPQYTVQEMTEQLTRGEFGPPPLEQCMPDVSPQVEHAIQHLRDFALPYFERVAASKIDRS